MDDVNGNNGHSHRLIDPDALGLKPIDIESETDQHIWKKRNVYQKYNNIPLGVNPNMDSKSYMPDKALLEIERVIQPLIEDRQKLHEFGGVLATIRYSFLPFITILNQLYLACPPFDFELKSTNLCRVFKNTALPRIL